MDRFFLVSLAAACLTAGVGYLPTVRIAGDGAAVAMLAGCGVCLLGSWASAVPMLTAKKVSGGAGVQAVMGSMAVRFAVVLAGVLVIALSEIVVRGPFLIWTGISYLVLLVPDTWFLLRRQSE